MSCVYLLYNPLSGNGKNDRHNSDVIKAFFKDKELIPQNITEINNYKMFTEALNEGDCICVCGGDGTLNRFVNDTDGMLGGIDVFYFPTGSGNDFYHEVGSDAGGAPVLINKYISDLPTVTVNGKAYRFLNGVGYGIDGYCCEVGDKLRAGSDKPVNYTSIAIKGLLFHFRPANAVITVDGEEYRYDKVWIAPTMKGKYYGGGMIPTPGQDRLSADKSVSVLAFHGSGRIKTLTVFPSIFKGEHINSKKVVTIHRGHSITVKFDRPTPLQIDGETVKDVTEYSVTTVPISADKQTVVSNA